MQRVRLNSGDMLATSHRTPHAAFEVPAFSLRHLLALTDDTGVLQHARYTVPQRIHGYCTDDNARALLTCAVASHVMPNDLIEPLMRTYAAFLEYALSNGRFRNFCSYERQWLEAVGSEDSHGRAIWGLGHLASASCSGGLKRLATELIVAALPACATLSYPRSIAFSLLGLDEHARADSDNAAVHNAHRVLAARLGASFTGLSDDWPWPEDVLTYDNAALCTALLRAGVTLKNDNMIRNALRSLDWLFVVQTATEGHLNPVGCNGWFPRDGERAQYCQQPLEACAMLHGALAAFAASGDDKWCARAWTAFEWFLGRNDLQLSLYDPESHGSRDGLGATGLNMNQGAESTLAWLISLLRVHRNLIEPSLL